MVVRATTQWDAEMVLQQTPQLPLHLYPPLAAAAVPIYLPVVEGLEEGRLSVAIVWDLLCRTKLFSTYRLK